MEGNLELWMNHIYRYKKYYFILFRDSLIYCDQKGGKKQGSFNL